MALIAVAIVPGRSSMAQNSSLSERIAVTATRTNPEATNLPAFELKTAD
jgi:hypothetical protein